MGNSGEGSSSHDNRILEFQEFRDQALMLHQQPQDQPYNYNHYLDRGGQNEEFLFPVLASAAAITTTSSSPSSSALAWPITPPVHQPLNPVYDRDRFFPSTLPPPPPLLPPPIPPTHHPFYTDLYSRRGSSAALQFSYGGGIERITGLASLYSHMGSEALVRGGGVSSSTFGGLHAELGKLSAQEIIDAKALAASKSHSEAERRRRERINAHLSKLRSLLPSTTKTDKASLLAEVIQHVKELKRQTSEIAEESLLPTEADELTVDATNDDDGRVVVRASLCCEDRSDLLPDLIKALKALKLRALKAEITTLGSRVKNVLVITGEEISGKPQQQQQQQQSVTSIQDALKAVMERTSSTDDPSSAGGIKRQRTTNLSSILEHNSI